MKIRNQESPSTVCVLISCMFQDKSIVERLKVQTNAVVINQCDENNIFEYDFINSEGRSCHVKFISTCERGLSRSRNMAIRNCLDDICVVCDDDEELAEGYEQLVLDGYNFFPDATVVTYKINRDYKNHRNYPPPPGVRHNLASILKTNSLEITFKRIDIISKGILFDEKMGSGTGNGSGEEEKFLMDIRRSGLSLYFYSNTIAMVHKGESQWFKGFDATYFYNKGWAMRRILGGPQSIMYLCYFVVSHYKQFQSDISFKQLVKSLISGWRSKR